MHTTLRIQSTSTHSMSARTSLHERTNAHLQYTPRNKQPCIQHWDSMCWYFIKWAHERTPTFQTPMQNIHTHTHACTQIHTHARARTLLDTPIHAHTFAKTKKTNQTLWKIQGDDRKLICAQKNKERNWMRCGRINRRCKCTVLHSTILLRMFDEYHAHLQC